jgi:hypothetical protein
VDRHRGRTQHHGDIDRDIVEFRQVASARLCRCRFRTVLFHPGMVTRWLS